MQKNNAQGKSIQKKSSILINYPDYEATIGIEVHVQLKTKTKIFCSCPNRFGDTPNANICYICSGYPGTLPVLNKKVVDYAIMLGLATNCSITQESEFDRKHYFYPDLPKNYQITQDKKPICYEGHVFISNDQGQEKKVRVLRIHMEEDAGKNIHSTTGKSWVDLNRAGTPLLEIVSYPDIASSHEARAYLENLHTLVRYLDISDANMDQGSFRADVNISVKKKTETQLGTRIELKNINSFKFITQAIEYEIERQISMLEAGEKLTQETRLWDSKKNQTYFMRSKEEGNDYRYFVEPDLPKLLIEDTWIQKTRESLPELPHTKRKRLEQDYNLSPYESEIVTSNRLLADFYEQTVKACDKPKQASNWILRDVLGYLKEQKLTLEQLVEQAKITPEYLGELILELDNGVINSKAAQTVFAELATTGKSPIAIIKDKNLEQIGSSEELEKIILSIIEQNPDNVEKYRAGNERVFKFLVGQAMKETKGKGNPKIIQELLKKHLA